MIKEVDIQRAILEYLYTAYKGKALVMRTNNVPIFDPIRKRYRAMPKYSIKGMADIFMLYKGKCIYIEVKKEKAYQSKEQKVFQWLTESNGGYYKVARSIKDVEDVLSIVEADVKEEGHWRG